MATYSSNKTQKITGFTLVTSNDTNGDHVLYTATNEEEIELDYMKTTGLLNYALQIWTPTNDIYAVLAAQNIASPNIANEDRSSFTNAFDNSRNHLEKLRIPPNFKLVLTNQGGASARTFTIYGKRISNSP